MEPDDLLCSRNARSRTPLVGRAQWKINQPPSLGKEAGQEVRHLQPLNNLTHCFIWPDPLFEDGAGPIIEPEGSPNGVQLHHIGRIPQKAELKIPRNPVHGCQHRSIGISIHLQRPKRETSAGNVMVRQPLRLQHSEKQIPVPAPQFGKLRCAQTGKKQHVAGGIVAKE